MKLEVSNWSTILQLKQLFCQACNQRDKFNGVSIKPDYIRMFCLGKELKDDLFLYSYDIKEEMTV